MLAVKYTQYGSEHITTTNDCKSVYDIIYNSTGNHELATKGYNTACSLHWGQSKELTDHKDKVTVICYKETSQIINQQGEIIDKNVLTVEDAVRAIIISLQTHGEVSGVIFRNEVWTARLEVSAAGGIRYFAYYRYKDGRSGTVEIQIAHGRPVLRTPGIQVIQPIMEKITRINDRVHSKLER